ncbi:lymphocyte cytosolic protein 2 isoform X2 [Anabas testudineus]|uniref:SH2 domain-containing protein n=1 Tax=Anabas testudineus TaxID=64144 RepID=A0A7N6BXF7_ANATE|nr:lymphocyte cytosolic protein 2 isoform X2 [Anabas testudineus]
MSFNNAPSKKEVMGWNSQSLSNYMRRLQLTGCDKVVIKGNITGAQFMQMTPSDLQAFPSLYHSFITKIQREIKKEEPKRSLVPNLKAHAYPKQVFVQDKDPWDSDELDNETECDYECPELEEGADGYICAMTESQTAEDTGKSEIGYEPPAYAGTVKPPRRLREANIHDCYSREIPNPAVRISKLQFPDPSRINSTLGRPLKISVSHAIPHIDRSKKPGKPATSQTGLVGLQGSAVKGPDSPTSRIPQPRSPKPRDLPNRPSRFIPPIPKEPAKVNNPTAGQGLDPSWYVGKVTRHEIEVALRVVNKDGAFVVRDSTKGFAEHPFTLMLLKQGKVYNIKIRNQGDSYSLGTGINNNKSFPGVKEMITHHAHTPLLLIDATDENSEVQNKCCLLYPAGL